MCIKASVPCASSSSSSPSSTDPLFDLELEDGTLWSPSGGFPSVPSEDLAKIKSDAALIGDLCSASSVEEERIVRAVRRTCNCPACAKLKDDAARLSYLADDLRRAAFDCEVCNNRACKTVKEAIRSPKHAFLKVRNVISSSASPSSCGGVAGAHPPTTYDVVVDLSFRSAFEVARATDHYAALLSAVPHTFVGSETSLRCVVGFMSEQLRRNFDCRKMACPPWRDRGALLNKWALCV